MTLCGGTAGEAWHGAAGAGGMRGDAAEREHTPKRKTAACVDDCDTGTQGPGL